MPQDSCLPFPSCKTRYAVGTVGIAVKHLSCKGDIFRTGKQAGCCNYVLKALSDRVGYIVVSEERTSVQLVPCVISYRNVGNQLFKRLFSADYTVTVGKKHIYTAVGFFKVIAVSALYYVCVVFYGERIHSECKGAIQSRRCQQRQYIRLLRLQDLCFLRLKGLRFAE